MLDDRDVLDVPAGHLAAADAAATLTPVVSETATHCPYCALQCGMRLTPNGASGPTVSGNSSFPVNRGALCVKGWTSAATLNHPERLRTPLVRDAAGRLVPASWEDALDRVAKAIRETRARHGADAVGVFGGGSLTNEKAYLLGKFARVALAHLEHRLQRPLLHVLGGRGRDEGVRHRSRPAVSARRHRRRARPSC